MPIPQRLPIVNGDDGQWGDILAQYLKKEHYDDATDNPVNGGHKTVTIRAGTATAGTAPLKFTSGTLLSSPEAGAMEFLSDGLYFTITTGTVRKTIALYDDSSGATGDIYYRNSSGAFTRLAIGNSDDVLKVSGGLPSWGAVSGTGDVSSNTASSVDSELALFNGTGGKTIKRATTTGILKGTSGVLSAAGAGDGDSIVSDASDSTKGKVELATAAETTTGTDATRAVTPDGLAGSEYGIRTVQLLVTDPNGSAITTGDGKAYFTVPTTLNGYNLIRAHAALTTVSSSGTPTIQIANVTDSVDMLSTRITIDANELTSFTAAAAAVIDTTKDDVVTGDLLRVDVDVAGTSAKGLMVILAFQLP